MGPRAHACCSADSSRCVYFSCHCCDRRCNLNERLHGRHAGVVTHRRQQASKTKIKGCCERRQLPSHPQPLQRVTATALCAADRTRQADTVASDASRRA
jgi:hypothetical protein